MEKISKKMLQKMEEEIREEFPHDEMMQELHLIRWLSHLEIKGMSIKEKLDYFNSAKKPIKKEG